MDSIASRSVALFSIHPTYARLLLDGSKRVEFRKTRIPDDLKYVVIYATSPVKRVVGYFSVAKVVISSPTLIWQRYGQVGGITEADFATYYAERKSAVAIEVAQMNRLDLPQLLSAIDKRLVPPQSFQYLAPSVLQHFSKLARRAA